MSVCSKIIQETWLNGRQLFLDWIMKHLYLTKLNTCLSKRIDKWHFNDEFYLIVQYLFFAHWTIIDTYVPTFNFNESLITKFKNVEVVVKRKLEQERCQHAHVCLVGTLFKQVQTSYIKNYTSTECGKELRFSVICTIKRSIILSKYKKVI